MLREAHSTHFQWKVKDFNDKARFLSVWYFWMMPKYSYIAHNVMCLCLPRISRQTVGQCVCCPYKQFLHIGDTYSSVLILGSIGFS